MLQVYSAAGQGKGFYITAVGHGLVLVSIYQVHCGYLF